VQDAAPTVPTAPAAPSAAASTPAPPRPLAEDFILITCDTLRADHLGAYGEKRPLTPRLDAFAQSALLFEEAYSNAPMTQPSVSCLLTGKLPGEIGVTPGNKTRMPSAAETLAERLRAAGFATAAVVSNYVLRSDPIRPDQVGTRQGFIDFDDRMTARERNRELRERVATDTTDAAIAWLEDPKRDPARRFFLWVHYQDPHGPYVPPDPYAKQVAVEARGEKPLRLGTNNRGRGQLPNYQVLGEERDPAVYRALYAAEVRYFDEELGRLLACLERRHLFERSLVIFTSDHGESLGDHGFWFCHGENVHRELVHVPLLVRTPATKEGRRIAAPASHLDVWPTALEALGLPHEGARGLVLLEPDRLPRHRLLAQFLRLEGNRPDWSALSDGRWRVVWNDEDDVPMLFDVRADPGELHDLHERFPERAAEMRRQFEELEASLVDVPDDGGKDGMTEEERARLKALGYADDGDDKEGGG
jgi:arylsulfatase A-like enzyme